MVFNPNFLTNVTLATLVQLPLSMIILHTLLLIRHLVWKMFSLCCSTSSSLVWTLSDLLITKTLSPTAYSSEMIMWKHCLYLWQHQNWVWNLWKLSLGCYTMKSVTKSLGMNCSFLSIHCVGCGWNLDGNFGMLETIGMCCEVHVLASFPLLVGPSPDNLFCKLCSSRLMSLAISSFIIYIFF
jgi:hypothetical protein